MPSCVRLDRGVRFRPAAAALIEQDNPVNGWVKIAPHRRAASAAGAAVKHDDGRAIRVTRLLDIDLMAIAYVQHPAVERIDRGI